MSGASRDRAALVEELTAANERWASDWSGEPPAMPGLRIAVVACMDARLPVLDALGLRLGDAHVIRNAGGVVTDDVVRSLVLSQRFLGTTAIVLVHHTDCGLAKVDDDTLAAELEAETGVRPGFAFQAFDDPEADTRESIERLEAVPFLPHRDLVVGFVYDVDTHRLLPVV